MCRLRQPQRFFCMYWIGNLRGWVIPLACDNWQTAWMQQAVSIQPKADPITSCQSFSTFVWPECTCFQARQFMELCRVSLSTIWDYMDYCLCGYSFCLAYIRFLGKSINKSHLWSNWLDSIVSRGHVSNNVNNDQNNAVLWHKHFMVDDTTCSATGPVSR